MSSERFAAGIADTMIAFITSFLARAGRARLLPIMLQTISISATRLVASDLDLRRCPGSWTIDGPTIVGDY